MLIISSWLSFAPSALLYFYLPQVHFYTFIHNTQSLGLQDKLSKKVRDVSKGGGGLQKNVHMTFLPDKIDM